MKFQALAIGLALTFVAPAAASAEPLLSDGYASRTLTLKSGVLRIDTAPSDYGFMDFGELNMGRGLRFNFNKGADAMVSLGVGAAYGITDEIEVGAHLLPLIFSPSFQFGDMELYGRYGFSFGGVQLAAQLTLRLPTASDFGMGLGLPALIKLGDSWRLDTGMEFELIFANSLRVNLDVPLAFSYAIGKSGFIGPRTGIRIPDFDALVIPLGVFGGITINDMIDISGSFNWPFFLQSFGGDAIILDSIEITVGATIYFGVN